MDRTIRRWTVLLFSLFVFVGADSAQAGAGPAYVTIVSGDGATRGADGAAFPTKHNEFSDDEFADQHNVVTPGDSVVTLEDGSAVLTLPDIGVVVHVERASELQYLPVLDNDVGASLRLLKGRAHISTRQPSDVWVVVAGGSEGGGYTLSKGASLALSVDANAVTVAVVRGEAYYFAGDVPAGRLLDDAGEPADKTGVLLPQGHHITSGQALEPVAGVPEALTASTGWQQTTGAAYAFGLKTQWVAQAAQGDFTPVRGATRGSAAIFPPDVGGAPQFTFDQPRSAAVAPAQAGAPRAVRTQAPSPVRALLATRRPGSVVVAQRLARARFVGSRGGIRVNPSVDPLIRLNRR